MTGDPHVDFVLDAGPRAFSADLPGHVKEEIAKAPAHRPYREACKLMAQAELAKMHAEIEATSIENRRIEWQAKDGIGLPSHRIPIGMFFKMEDLYGVGCWKDKDFVEDVLKYHPGLRIKVTRGTRGQEYGNRPQISSAPIPSQIKKGSVPGNLRGSRVPKICG